MNRFDRLIRHSEGRQSPLTHFRGLYARETQSPNPEAEGTDPVAFVDPGSQVAQATTVQAIRAERVQHHATSLQETNELSVDIQRDGESQDGL